MKNVVLPVTGMALGFLIGEKCQEKQVYKLENDNAKFYEFYDVLLQWIKVHQSGRTLADYFHKYGYRTVAIYGMKELGLALWTELQDTGVVVKYGIDNKVNKTDVDVNLFQSKDNLGEVDVIVVTAMHDYADIEMELKDKMKCPIVALNDVVYEA